MLGAQKDKVSIQDIYWNAKCRAKREAVLIDQILQCHVALSN